MSARPFKWVVEFSVDPSWVADGFELTQERALAMLASDIGGAYNHEIDARIVRAPTAARIRRVQGCES